MDTEKLELIQSRAIEIANEQIEKYVRGLGDDKIEKLAETIIIINAAVTARLLVEYDNNKEAGNI
ncbi:MULTISPECIES: hypothetical protein [Peribacillus]|uniref:Uncharacterized protein n=1 Tax=Peribacillus asahii TaxID=228899 RepID=A0A3Q9RMS4_9BACI|nr:hypothetical protein [Peribacillus asahii]AZV42710.1 hypothetical protein BAOM_2101 [Peribacillus asahii]USK86967.1 hypothetical protein LIT35_10180 [Peribacillus asahii]HWL22398.1 hypothetical protein [Ureibacillus sp.]